ncbi:hypothetical protein PV10_08419 [Exophiala mesophila]|uniref:RNA helicase n=1 Tax=Exophiala mesophila TaxID=212818 RepID=A0A0D1Z4C3_EXOME|nr:uncharacterized protein PV10_08419 [Exophiala mesophila]KIV88774.1 hypothetical protein PV10_08419 [Exophiala mesophila]
MGKRRPMPVQQAKPKSHRAGSSITKSLHRNNLTDGHSPTPSSSLPPPSIDVPDTTPRFKELRGLYGIDPAIIDTLTDDLKFDHMMPVQAATLAPLLEGNDCLAQAKTGTGKTMAFLLPAVKTLLQNRTQRLSALVLCPTRELALQIADEAKRLLQRFPRVKVATSIGGTNKNTEAQRILNGCDILVATPGRLLDHLSGEQSISVDTIQTLVLDEADRMLDMGFLPDMQRILAYIPKGPRQTMLFSATMDDQIANVTKLFLREGYKYISTIPEGEANTHERVNQYLVTTPSIIEHAPALVSLVRSELATSDDFKAIVFAPTAAQADFFGHVLASTRGLPPVSILHSRLSQSKRTNITAAFRTSKNAICVATDVIARGMDFPGVSHVFQVGLPPDRESYIHRLGRTARAGAEGCGLLILSQEETVFLNQLKKVRVQKYEKPLDYKVQDISQALATLEQETKEKVYRACLGYLKMSARLLRWSSERVVQEANKFALQGLDCPEVPPLEKRLIGKMGLKGVPGLVVVPNAPGSSHGRPRTGDRGR